MANKPLKSIKWPNLPDTYVVEVQGDTLNDYAKIDGYYESLTAGQANQLISDVYEEDKTPYVFRTSGGSIDIGDRETDMVVGGTVAWNQLANNNNAPTSRNSVTFASYTDYFTMDGTSSSAFSASGWFGLPNSAVMPLKGHAVYVDFQLISGTVSNASKVALYVDGRSSSKVTLGNSRVVKVPTDLTSSNQSNLEVDEGGIVFTNVKARLQVIDLTLLFGSTIADYIYSLEQATAGAGVAWFKKLFPKPYYAYNAGELMSVNTSAHNTVGFNQWDEEWEVGDIDANGANSSANDRIRSKNYVPVLPNTPYYFGIGTSSMWLWGYDADKNYVGRLNNSNSIADNYLVIPENINYIRFVCRSQYGTTYNHDICINLSWDGERDGEYEAYVKHSYALDSDLVLRGIPKLDNGNLYYDGDTYESDGSVTRKYGIVDLGTLTWTKNNAGFMWVRINGIKLSASSTTKPNVICPKYATDIPNNVYTLAVDKIISVSNGSADVWIYDSSYTDAATFKTAMSGVYLVYELATPTTETADPYTNPQIVNDFGTEEYVDYPYSQGTRDVAIPVGHQTQYMANLKAKLEMMPNSPEGAGDYIVRQTNGENSYVSVSDNTTISGLVSRCPVASGEDGTYVLKATISGGTVTYAWVAE